MWFDLVLIDRVFADGSMSSHHIRSDSGDAFPVSPLEDIDPTFRDVDVVDNGSVRLYGANGIKISVLNSNLKHFVQEQIQTLLQLEHIGMPVKSGYYAIVFPRGWRIKEINVYDPYHSAQNVAEKRTYRDVDVLWDKSERLSCAQFNMNSVQRGTFSIGVIASIISETSDVKWIDRKSPIRVLISDARHQGDDAKAYGAEAKRVMEGLRAEPTHMPGINVSALGIPSVNIVNWGNYIKDKIRRVR